MNWNGAFKINYKGVCKFMNICDRITQRSVKHMAFDKNKYDQNFKKEKYDRIDILIPKGDKDKIKAYADANGTTVSQICKDAIYEKINNA